MIPDYLKIPENTSQKIWGTLERKDKLWHVEGHPYMISMAKRLFPGSKGSSRSHGTATFPATKRIIGDLNWFMHRFPLEIKETNKWLKELEEAQEHFQKQESILKMPTKISPSPKFKGKLLEFQKEGLAFLLHNPRSLLADQMGLGKTPVSLSWLVSLKCGPPYIVVAPPHLLRQWTSEIHKFLGENTAVHIIKGLKPYDLPLAHIYLIHYLILRGWKNYLPEFGFNACVFDEIQELRRDGSEKYNGASLLAEATENVIGLSGTPVYNMGFEIYNILNILEYHCLGDSFSFRREWCDGDYSTYVNKPAILGDFLKEEGLMLRRRKEEVLSELPPKRRLVQNIDVDKGTFDSMISSVVENAKAIPEIKDAFERGRSLREAINETRMITGIAKAHYVCAFVKTLLEAGETVVLYAHHHRVMDIYLDELKEYYPVMISGRQTAKVKDLAQKAFMKGDTDLIIISLRSGTGLNLQRARCVVFGELDWAPAVHCIDEKTEILTKNGFKGVDNINIRDDVAGFDIKDESICFVPVLSKVDRITLPNEKIYKMKTKHIDLVVTNNHRMIYRTLRRRTKGNVHSEWKISTAEKIAGIKGRYIPVCGNEKTKGVDLSDDELRLIGLFLSDGNFDGKHLTIYQSVSQPWNKNIVEILNGAGMSWSLFIRKYSNGRSDMNYYTIPAGIRPRWTKKEVEKLMLYVNKGLSNRDIAKKLNRTTNAIYLKKHKIEKGRVTPPGSEKPKKGWKAIEQYLDKNLSSLLEDVTFHQLGCLIYGFWLGDGAKDGCGVKRIINTNKILMDRLQSLCVRRGKKAVLIERKKTKQRKTVYDIFISNRKDVYLQDSKKRKNRFKCDVNCKNKRVWCINNKLGTIIIRRNGKIAIVGNSQCEDRLHRIGQKDSVLCYYLVCPAGTDMHMQETLGLKTSQFINIMGDKAETEEDKLMAQVDVKKHMEKVLTFLQEGGRKKEITLDVQDELRKLEKMPKAEEPTSLDGFYKKF